MKICLKTLGCKVNAIETDSIAALFLSQGDTLCSTPEEADVLVLNSCTVTASGDSRMLHLLRQLRQAAPQAVLVLTGCYVQAFPEAAAALPEADILVGTSGKAQIPALVKKFRQTGERLTALSPVPAQFQALPSGGRTGHTRAFLKIQDGCDRYCSYCIIPYARGSARSLPLEGVRREAELLAGQGYPEIVLCGINLACWGQEEGLTLADAVKACAAAGFPRVRLSSLEPDGLTDAVLHDLAAVPELCPHFHIALQSGCDRTLRAMGRGYDSAGYAAMLDRLRHYLPDAAVMTDMIAGFPGETEEDFAQSLAFAERMQFADIHVFPYSVRPGTAAAAMPEQVIGAVKRARADRLHALAQELRTAYLQSCTGKTLSVLFERERGKGFHQGHAAQYVTVKVPFLHGDEDWQGSIRQVRITGIDGDAVLGVLA